jgi:DNA-binding MarR family transcriptional regulator
MTPLETFKFLKTKDVDLKEMALLERLNFFHRPMMTGDVVYDATKGEAFASQATVFKYLTRLKDRGCVEEIEEVSDQRCTYILITNKGKKLLKEWS